MDKAIYLLNRGAYRKELVENLTQKDLEEWVADEDYEDDFSVMKIDCSSYNNPTEALRNEMAYAFDGVEDGEILSRVQEDYYFFAFGFEES